jgi:HEAT repeats/Putative zinc-finger
MSSRKKLASCADIGPLLVFYACSEVDPQEREAIDAHLAACPACAKQLDEELTFQTAFSAASQPADQLDPSGALLAQCRSELSEQLDDLSAPQVRPHWVPFGWVRRWMALRPAWSAAALVLLGLGVGIQMSPWFTPRDGGRGVGNGTDEVVNVMSAPRLTDEELSKMAVAGINFSPASDTAPGTLQLQVRTEQPMEVIGNVDDADVRRVLTYVVANGERFDPGVRLDCLDALRTRTRDTEVRTALLSAARKDPNPAVRMKALEALRDSGDDQAVRETLLETLRHDANPGVRVEAVNLLVRSLEGEPLEGTEVSAEAQSAAAELTSGALSVERVVRALEDLQRRDPNRYVRLRSAAALRQISPRDVQ